MLTAEQKKEGGQLANKIKKEVTAAFDELKSKLSKPRPKAKPTIDVTLPGQPVRIGNSHIITQTISQLLEMPILELIEDFFEPCTVESLAIFSRS